MSFFTRPPKAIPQKQPVTLGPVTLGKANHSVTKTAPTETTSAENDPALTDILTNIMSQLEQMQQQIADLGQTIPSDTQDKPDINDIATALHSLSSHHKQAPSPSQSPDEPTDQAPHANDMDHLIAQALLKWEQHQQLTNPDWPKLEQKIEQAFVQSLEDMPVFTPFEAIMLANNLLAQLSQQLETKPSDTSDSAEITSPTKDRISAKKYHNSYPDQGAGRAHTPKPKTPRAAFEAALAKIESRQV